MPRLFVLRVDHCDMCWFNATAIAQGHVGNRIPTCHVCTLVEQVVPHDKLGGIPQFCPLREVDEKTIERMKDDGIYGDPT